MERIVLPSSLAARVSINRSSIILFISDVILPFA
jgi:hypothetical protein